MLRKRLPLPLVIVAVLAIAGVVGYQAWKRHLANLPLEWSGTIEARKVEVGSRQGGRVKEVLVREGEQVNANQPLLRLESGDLEAQRLQAQGQVEQAEANFAKVSGRGFSSRRQEVAAARARLQAQEIAGEKAALDFNRTKKLFGDGASTKAELDDADIVLRNATTQRSMLQAQLDELLRGTPEDVRAANGQLDIAHGRLQQIETMLDELTVRAPMAARVETLDLRPGDILVPDAVAAKLLEADQLYVRIYVPETQLGYIHQAQVVPIHVDSFPTRTFRSTVEYVSSEGEFTPRNLQTADERADQVFSARLRLDDGKDILRAGMAAFAQVAK
jgi:multidrug resistance efflux pump